MLEQPKSIKIKILNYLDLKEIIDFRLVNRYFDKLITDTVWNHDPEFHDNKNTRNPETIKNIIRKFKFKNCNFYKLPIDDSDLNFLTYCETINLSGTNITDAGVITLSNYNCTDLDISFTGVTDVGVTALGKNKHLKHLDLGKTKVTDKGIAALKNCKKLKSLVLFCTKITDASIFSLCKDSIKGLNLSGTEITDAGVRELTKFTKLEILYLSSTKATGASIRNLTNLVNLYLSFLEITDEDALYIYNSNKKLKVLYLYNTLVTCEVKQSLNSETFLCF